MLSQTFPPPIGHNPILRGGGGGGGGGGFTSGWCSRGSMGTVRTQCMHSENQEVCPCKPLDSSEELIWFKMKAKQGVSHSHISATANCMHAV